MTVIAVVATLKTLTPQPRNRLSRRRSRKSRLKLRKALRSRIKRHRDEWEIQLLPWLSLRALPHRQTRGMQVERLNFAPALRTKRRIPVH
jgi:hypothetical protein